MNSIFFCVFFNILQTFYNKYILALKLDKNIIFKRFLTQSIWQKTIGLNSLATGILSKMTAKSLSLDVHPENTVRIARCQSFLVVRWTTMDLILMVGQYYHLPTSKELTALLLILDMLYKVFENNGIYNETWFFESVYFLFFFG